MAKLNTNSGVQKVPYTRDAYIQAGCQQFGGAGGSKEDPMGRLLWLQTEGFLCNGCVYLRSGCTAHGKLATGYASTGNAPLRVSSSAQPAESVRAEATRRGVSINEVRRQRAEKINTGAAR